MKVMLSLLPAISVLEINRNMKCCEDIKRSCNACKYINVQKMIKSYISFSLLLTV